MGVAILTKPLDGIASQPLVALPGMAIVGRYKATDESGMLVQKVQVGCDQLL